MASVTLGPLLAALLFRLSSIFSILYSYFIALPFFTWRLFDLATMKIRLDVAQQCPFFVMSWSSALVSYRLVYGAWRRQAWWSALLSVAFCRRFSGSWRRWQWCRLDTLLCIRVARQWQFAAIKFVILKQVWFLQGAERRFVQFERNYL